MDTIWLYVAIGSACLISSSYFYCTYKNQKSYHDSEVPEIQISR